MKALEATEAKVRASNTVLAGVIESAPVALLMTDRKMRVLQASHRWRTDMGARRPRSAGAASTTSFPARRTPLGRLPSTAALKGEVIRARRAKFCGCRTGASPGCAPRSPPGATGAAASAAC